MDGNVVTAARWFGISLIVSSVVLAVGLFTTADHCSKRMSSAIRDAGSNSRPHIAIPGRIELNHRTNGMLNVDLSPNNKSINLNVDLESDPVKVSVQEHNVHVRTDNPILFKDSP